MSTQLYPEVKDGTTLGAVFSRPSFMAVGIEGWASLASADAINVPRYIQRPSEAVTAYGAASSLTALVTFVLNRGVPGVWAVASVKHDSVGPTLVQRQASWALLESMPDIRIRLTDSTTQADLVALADSCEAAELANNKQFAIMGMPTATSKSGLTAAATAIGSKRGILVGPGVYDDNAVLRNGSFSAAAVAAMVSTNPDIVDDLDTAPVPGFTDIEHDTSGLPLFRVKSTGGVLTNDFEDLLQGGVSALRRGRANGVEITHLRTTWLTDTTYDALQTLLIRDQLFIDVRDYVETSFYLRRGNTQKNRDDMKAGVEALLNERSNWLTPLVQNDGERGYSVSVISSADGRQVTIGYKGQIVRGIQVVLVDANLQITV